MMRGMYSAISGLKNHQIALDVTANDLANVNTDRLQGRPYDVPGLADPDAAGRLVASTRASAAPTRRRSASARRSARSTTR